MIAAVIERARANVAECDIRRATRGLGDGNGIGPKSEERERGDPGLVYISNIISEGRTWDMGKVLGKASHVLTYAVGSVAQHREIRASRSSLSTQITLNVDSLFKASLPFHGRRKSNDCQE